LSLPGRLAELAAFTEVSNSPALAVSARNAHRFRKSPCLSLQNVSGVALGCPRKSLDHVGKISLYSLKSSAHTASVDAIPIAEDKIVSVSKHLSKRE
jgi:hypothetical protein